MKDNELEDGPEEEVTKLRKSKNTAQSGPGPKRPRNFQGGTIEKCPFFIKVGTLRKF